MTTLELSTEAELAAGGNAVARAPDGRIVFIEGAAPDERVRIRIVKDNPRFLRARVVEVVAASASRVAPRCEHFGVCGGCSLQHVSSQAQLLSKQAALLSSLRKLGGVEPESVLAPWSGASYGYRGRARLAVGADGRLGYRRSRGREVVTIDRCPILHPALQAALSSIRTKSPPRGPRALNLVLGPGERVAARWDGPGGDRTTAAPVTWVGSVSDDPGLLASGVWHHPDVFSQSNPEGNLALRAQIDDWLRRGAPFASAVELYAGSGNLTLTLAEHAPQVTAFESSSDAVGLAKRVLPAHVHVMVATAEEATATTAATPSSADIVLVDPPRAGLSAVVAEGISRWARRAIAYVSCDPATFARDAGRLQAAGWSLREVRLFDLYPQTAHSEVAGWFTPVASTPDTCAESRG